MDRAPLRVCLAATLVLLTTGSFAFSADDDLREKALKLNQVTGTTAMSARLFELMKDKETTKKLLVEAVKMAKDEKKPLKFNACFILARAAQGLKDVPTAEIFYKLCADDATKLGSASKIIDVFDNMIDLYSQNKKFDEAIRACQEFLDIQVDDVESPINQMKPFILEKLVLATARKGKIDEALKIADNLIEKDKGGWYFVRLKAEVYREAEKYGDAADSYLQTIDRLKNNKRLEEAQREMFIKRIRYGLSNIYVELKQIDKSAEQLEILMKEDPDNPTYMNDLGFVWADHDMKVDEAEKLIRKAIEKDREQRKKIEDLPKDEDVDNAAYLDSLGWVLFKQKKYADAKKELLTATKLEDGKHIEILDHLADVHMALGEKADAVKIWKDALKQDNLSRREKERKKIIEQKLADAEKK
ncbi:tetratricopeptide repeat protein [Zavarzinella formosa]|uniref:tetratricopeptide repeat protein n=1 Tax=Zavarzinella formosa TaxID=360055 RepID=UPI000302C9C4|nr:tetratricopeptide repeat protein [Zavarzinella formosa]